MALYHLDPRQAGAGTAPDVYVYGGEPGQSFGVAKPWVYIPHPDDGRCDAIGYFDTEAAALRAAREAAGFGHVAERPCDERTQRTIPVATFADDTDKDECGICAWPRDAHRVQP